MPGGLPFKVSMMHSCTVLYDEILGNPTLL
jgi:hypothetical protein